MGVNEETFKFEAYAEEVAVVHQPTNLIWRFAVERPKPLLLRSLKPRRTSDTPPQTKDTLHIRRSAYAFAVTEARRLGMID